MNKTGIFMLIFLAILIVSLVFVSAKVSRNAVSLNKVSNKGVLSSTVNSEVRVLAHTDKEIRQALKQGCRIVRDAKTVKALVCNKNKAKALNLGEDPKIYASDSGANSQVKANQAYTEFGATGEGRKIVVLDTGYNYLHPDLVSSYLGGYDFYNNDLDPFDDNGHGSHVAGLITSDGIDSLSKGIAPETGIISGKVLNNENAGGTGFMSDLIASIYWSVDGSDGIYGTADDWNADAISMSLGTTTFYTFGDNCDLDFPDLKTAVDYAVSKKIVVVAAAGNGGMSGVDSPACISSVIAVGNVKSDDVVYITSSRGNALDLVAPGVGLYSTLLGVSYGTMTGTSMATPLVSGTVALIKEISPSANSSQIRNLLISTAKDLYTAGWDYRYGWGRLDVYNATQTCINNPDICSVNYPPLFEPIENRNVSVGEELIIILNATDPEGDNITYSKNVSSGSIVDNVFIWAPGAEDIGTHNIIFSAYDGENSASQIAIIEVYDAPQEINFLSCRALDKSNKIYYLDSNIENNSLTSQCLTVSGENVTLDCQGNSIISTSSYPAIFSNQKNTIIKNCNLDMGKQSIQPGNGGGILLENADNSVVENNDISGSDYGIKINSGSGIFIEENTFFGNFAGIINNQGENIEIRNNYFSNGFECLKMNGNSEIIEGNNIENCQYGIRTWSDYSVIVNNTWANNFFGLHIYSSENIIENNAITGSADAVTIRGNGNIVKNNILISNRYGLIVSLARDNTLENNILEKNTEMGIGIEKSVNNTIIDNLISGSSYWGAMYLASASGNNITGNTACDDSTGIYGANSVSLNCDSFSSNNFGGGNLFKSVNGCIDTGWPLKGIDYSEC